MAVVVARYLADGDLDWTFGSKGKVRTQVDGIASVCGVDIDRRDQITVLAGGDALRRITYTSRGTVTNSQSIPFFPDAFVNPQFPDIPGKWVWAAARWTPSPIVATGVATAGPEVISTGRLLAGGWARLSEAGPIEMAIARYLPSGEPDAGFSANGQVTDRFFPGRMAEARGIDVDGSGRTLVAGYAFAGEADFDFALLRLRPDGTLDPSFSQDGRARTRFPSATSVAAAITTDRDGRAVAAGRVMPAATSEERYAIAKYGIDGSLDPSFGAGDGLVTAAAPWGASIEANAITGDARARFVVVGRFTNTSQAAIARFLPDGGPDMTFGARGFAAPGLAPSPAWAAAAHVDAIHEKITVVGTADGQFSLIRLRNDGAPAPFGVNGAVLTQMGGRGEQSAAQAVTVDSCGRIVVAGIAGRVASSSILSSSSTIPLDSLALLRD